jgi:plasmid maintenance system antidote protein VapI
VNVRVSGERHHRAKLSDHEVEMLRRFYVEGWGYRRLARVFEIGREHVRDIVLERRRLAG